MAELDMTGLTWSKGEDRVKNEQAHVLPLSATAANILNTMDSYGSDYVFPAKGQETRTKNHINGFSDMKEKLDKLSGVTEWVFHDFRRTGATYLAKLKTPPHIIERILNHKDGEISGVAKIYNRYAYLEEMHDALSGWDHYIDDLIQGRKPTIVPFARASS